MIPFRVLYEEERNYYSAQGTITEICIGGYMINGRVVSEYNIRQTNDEVEKAARAKMCGYKEQCDFASRVR